MWHPAKLQAQISRLLDQPDLLVVGSGMRLMLPDGRIITWPARAERISQRLLLRNRVKELHSSTLAMRRDVFAKAGLYDEETPNGYAEDYDWILRAARVGRIGAVAPRWPTSGRTAARGGRVTPPSRPRAWNTSWPSTRRSRHHRAAMPACSGRSPFPGPCSAERGRALRYAALAVARWPASPHAYLALAHIVTGVDRKHVLRAARLVGRGLARHR